MAKNEEIEEPEESFEEFEEDFDDDDLGGDLDDDMELVDEEDVEDEPKPKKRSSSDDDLSEANYEQAVRANPKRATALKKRASLIETILDDAKLDSEEGIAKAWATLNEEVDTKIKRKYAISAELKENEVIDHPSFGVGFVNQILSGTKVEVIFETGLKRLVCNKG